MRHASPRTNLLAFCTRRFLLILASAFALGLPRVVRTVVLAKPAVTEEVGSANFSLALVAADRLITEVSLTPKVLGAKSACARAGGHPVSPIANAAATAAAPITARVALMVRVILVLGLKRFLRVREQDRRRPECGGGHGCAQTAMEMGVASCLASGTERPVRVVVSCQRSAMLFGGGPELW